MDIQSPTIENLLTDVLSGQVVLPDFQREFVWKAEDIQDLLVSALADYYVGTMLYMDQIHEKTEFAVRLIYGVELISPTAKPKSIVKLLLDGQQRCSALFYALHAPEIPLHGRKSAYRFAMNIPLALESKWDQAVVAYAVTSKDAGKYTGDDYIQFSDFLNTPALLQKISENKWKGQIHQIFPIINRFNNFKIQMVELKRDTPIDTVVEIFERINRTGMPLNITDLLTARLIRRGVKLRDLVNLTQETYSFIDDEEGIPTEFILRTMCILNEKEVNKKNILNLPADTFEMNWNVACTCLEKAYRQVVSASGGFGAIDFKRLVPFRTMIIPLGIMLHFAEKAGLPASAYSKIAQWYWVSVFSNRYNEAVNTTTFSDIPRMKDWMSEVSEAPEFIKNFKASSVEFTVSSKSSSTYRGILCLIIMRGALDFKSGKPPLLDMTRMQDDHIFPRVAYNDNSILNRTLLTTNTEKSNQHPSKYFSALETVHGRDGLLSILDTHFINEACLHALLSDDIEQFKKARRSVLIEFIEKLVPAIDAST